MLHISLVCPFSGAFQWKLINYFSFFCLACSILSFTNSSLKTGIPKVFNSCRIQIQQCAYAHLTFLNQNNRHTHSLLFDMKTMAFASITSNNIVHCPDLDLRPTQKRDNNIRIWTSSNLIRMNWAELKLLFGWRLAIGHYTFGEANSTRWWRWQSLWLFNIYSYQNYIKYTCTINYEC